MADLSRLQEFAVSHGFDLTRPLTHEAVTVLAEYWLPDMRFYEDERFHPIALDDMLSMVERLFAELPPSAQNTWRVTKLVRSSAAMAVARAFDPPVVYVPDGVAARPSPQSPVPVVRVLNDGSQAADALERSEVNGNTRISHGASFERAMQFFGAVRTLHDTNSSSPGDPFLPRADEAVPGDPGERRPRMTVMASLLNLLDLLKYELRVAGEADYPPDGLRGGFNVVPSLLHPDGPQPPPFPAADQRTFLLDLIAWHESGAGGQQPQPRDGWRLDRRAWDAVTRFAFLEYDFFYAYNDFERYQTAIFDNEHEADNEGCCLVFDRRVINLAVATGDIDMLRRVVPHSIITSVHEEYQNADLLRFIPTPVPDPANPAPLARGIVDFTVYIAGGSHATYLTPGRHDLVDFGDYWGWVEENASPLLILAPLILVVAIILSIIEHFVDTEDFTSDDGVRGGPPDVVGGHPTAVSTRLITMPMSAGNHIYDGQHHDLLRLRAFAGRWGGHDGLIDDSPAFEPKTARYFRKLIDQS